MDIRLTDDGKMPTRPLLLASTTLSLSARNIGSESEPLQVRRLSQATRDSGLGRYLQSVALLLVC